MPALEGALTEALSGKLAVVENNTDTVDIVEQEFGIHASQRAGDRRERV